MILDYITKRFRFSTWTFLLIGVVVILFILWLFFANHETSSASTSFNESISKMFQPVQSIPKSNQPVRRETSFSSKGETKCREIMERLTGERFDNVRPFWLVNPVTGQKLELDCYSEKLKLAVEYNGKQHYEYNRYMHQNSKDKFYNQQYRDLIKKDLCEKHKVKLIVVPYDIPNEQIESFLVRKLSEIL
jgi:hypothetical protein|tara:strand:+ start:28 stop:597 length:570 start_codon:yes stop_codon:yes gene_type:complete